MPRYQSKPRVIEAVQFREVEPWPEGVCRHRFAAGPPTFVVYNRLHDSYIKLKDGDYVRQDDPNDRYPIDEDTFLATYEPLTTEGDDNSA